MKIRLVGLVSTSLRRSDFEYGENLQITATFALANGYWATEIENRFNKVLKLIDHSHLSESKHLQLKDFNELPEWIYAHLEDLEPHEIQIQINASQSLKWTMGRE